MADTFLDSLDAEGRRLVLSKMTRRRFPRGHHLFHAGDLGDTLHMVVKGHVAIRPSTDAGDEATLTVHGPGNVYGELALLSSSARRTASAVALDDVEVKVLHAKDFHDLVATYPAVLQFLVNTLAGRVRRLTEQVMTALYTPADQRVVSQLIELAEMYDEGVVPIVIGIRQDDLASMAGTSRPTANRVLRQLDEESLVSLRRGQLSVHDLDLLRQRAR